jgi:hypothetical protein
MAVQEPFSFVEDSIYSNSAVHPPNDYKQENDTSICMTEMSRLLFAPANFLQRLSLSRDVELRIAVVDYKDAPDEVLFFLADDESPDVRYALAENHNISINVLKKLSADPNPYVADRAERTLLRRTA